MKYFLIAAVVLLVCAGIFATLQARKLDSLHKRIDQMQHNLDRALLQRAACALGIARAGILDPASSILLEEAALEALHASRVGRGSSQRAVVESNLSQVITATADRQTLGKNLFAELQAADSSVQIAMKIHNGAVVRVRQIRSGAIIRLLHLAGGAPLPETIDIGEGLE